MYTTTTGSKHVPSYQMDDTHFWYRISPEQRLVLHVLYRAIRDLFETEPSVSNGARAWLEGRARRRYPWFTCDDCCEILEMDRKVIIEVLNLSLTPDAKLSVDNLARCGFGSL